jgi:hypothetical protein
METNALALTKCSVLMKTTPESERPAEHFALCDAGHLPAGVSGDDLRRCACLFIGPIRGRYGDGLAADRLKDGHSILPFAGQPTGAGVVEYKVGTQQAIIRSEFGWSRRPAQSHQGRR